MIAPGAALPPARRSYQLVAKHGLVGAALAAIFLAATFSNRA
jgi:hypothetical protein